MPTRTLILDRLVTLLVGLALVVGAVAAWAWYYSVVLTGPAIEVAPAQDLLAQEWWPWALAAIGILLVVVGLRRMAAHIPDRGVNKLRLRRSDDTGGLAVDSGPLASAASDEIAAVDGVRSSHGKVLRERGQLVMELVVLTEPAAHLPDVTTVCDQVAAVVARMAERDDLTFRVDLRVARRGRSVRRAR